MFIGRYPGGLWLEVGAWRCVPPPYGHYAALCQRQCRDTDPAHDLSGSGLCLSRVPVPSQPRRPHDSYIGESTRDTRWWALFGVFTLQVFYVFLGCVAGYVSARLYKSKCSIECSFRGHSLQKTPHLYHFLARMLVPVLVCFSTGRM